MLRTLCLLMLLISNAAFGQAPVPDTPAGKAFSALLAAFNSADPQQIAAFDKAYQQTRTPVQSTLNLRDRTGGFTLLRIEKSEPYALEALLKENDSDTAVRFKLAVGADEQHPVLQSVQFNPVSMPAELRPARLDQAAALAGLRARIAQMAAQDKFSGRVLVARHGKILLDESRGLADREAKVAVGPDTRFRIGSMNKMFTAIAILQLAEAGKLSLADPLVKFLPDYQNKEMAGKVTIRHLLSHTGGTGDIFGPGYDSYRLALRTHDDYLAHFGARALLKEPGAFQYSNYGFVLLGAVIERVSGMSYYDYVDARIFRPAGMTATGSLPEDVAVPGRSQGYMRRDGSWQRNTDTLPYRGSAAGGGYSTARDLLAFAEALAAGKLVTPATLAEATEPAGKGDGYGLGFLHDGEGLARMYGHNGGAPGMTAALWVYPKAGYVLIGLSNLDQDAATRPLMYFNRRMPLD